MRIAALIAVSVLGGSAVAAAPSPPPFQGPVLAQDRVLGRAIDTLQVTSTAVLPGQPIPIVYSAYGKSLSIPLSWTSGPRATRSYAIVMEDPDSHLPQPTLHWLVYNIPAGVTALPKGVKDREAFSGPHGFMQGRNSKGGIGYVGPHPPAADPPHHYHIQVFALSRMLDVAPGATLDQVVAAMNDRVLAEGELVGTFSPHP